MNPVDSSNYGESQPLKVNAAALVVQSVYTFGWSSGIADVQLI